MEFTVILSQMLILLLMMCVGYIAYKVNIIDQHATHTLSKIVINITLPAQILTSTLKNRNVINNQTLFRVLFYSIIIYLIIIITSYVFLDLFRVPSAKKGTYQYMFVFGNVGFMGFPVVSSIFGNQALIYAVIFNILFNILVFSIGIEWISTGKDQKMDFKKLMNFPLLSILFTMILFLLHVSLPNILDQSLTSIGNITTPLAMLIIGSSIAAIPMNRLMGDMKMIPFTIGKLLLLPFLIYLFLLFIPTINPLAKQVFVILAGTPVAVNASMLAIEYNGDAQTAAKGIFFTTICSVLTIPIISLIFT